MADATAVISQPYAVLARKYRSRTFDEVVGQEHVAQTLKKAIETGRVHHAYLFCGTRGVGKTSMARILALALNDPQSDAPTATPDPTTDVASAIFKGDDVDVIEIDAASNTGVDNVRDLIENARFRPMRSRFKVYIIDEVHMLSKAAFNALLKIMEEPPEHVKFILATTEPEKVLPTILSRVQRFDFRNIAVDHIVAHLKDVIEQENRKADDDALRLVARNGQGSMRDSLSLLDRLTSGLEKGGTLKVDDVTSLLGLPPRQRVMDLVDAFGNGDTKAALTLAETLLRDGQGTDSLIGAVIDHLHALLVRNVAGDDAELADLPGLDPKLVAQQAAKLSPELLSQDIAILEELRRQMRSGGAGRALLDATLVRLALAEQFASIDDLLAGGASTAQKKTAEIRPSEPEPLENVEPVASGGDGFGDLWARLNGALSREHETVAPLLQSGQLGKVDAAGGVVEIVFPSGTPYPGMLERNGKREAVAAVLGRLLDLPEPPQLHLRADASLAADPQPHRGNAPSNRGHANAPSPREPSAVPSDLNLEADPLVAAAIRELGARVVKVEDE